MDLENLVIELSKNPNALRKIEDLISQLVVAPDLSPIKHLQATTNPTVYFYLCKTLELRIKAKIASSLKCDEEIVFVTKMLQFNPTYHVCDIFSLLGLYFWPLQMPNFFDEIFKRLDNSVGYQILLSFLEKLNCSTDIDDKRRSELKKAISIISNNLFLLFKDEFAQFIIPIFTQFLKIIPKTFDFSIVYSNAELFPDKALDFILEAFDYLDCDKLNNILVTLPEDPSLIQLITNSKKKNVNNSNKAYEYVFKSLVNSQECFIPALDFWQKIFSSLNNENIVEPVLIQVIKSYLEIDDDFKGEIDSYFFAFISIIAKNYPNESSLFLQKNANALPVRITSNFIQKLNKHPNGIILLHNLSFNSPYLNCLVSFLRNDPQAQSLIFTFNFEEKEEIRLALQMLSKCEYSREQLISIMNRCQSNQLSSNEIKVECLISLGMEYSFEGEWNMDKVIMYYYFLKKNPTYYSGFKEYYYGLFIQTSPFDRCFAILERIGDVPHYILENIYNKIEKYPLIDLCCFNNDLLPYLPVKKPFIEKEVSRFILEWETMLDHKIYYQALRSLLGIYLSNLDKEDLIDSLINLLQIEYSPILNKVITLFNNYKGKYNTQKALYFLLKAYNSFNLNDSQSQISSSLTECMYQEDGPQAYSQILGLDINKCVDIKNQIIRLNKKSSQNIIRNLLKDFKGKSINKIFENDFKITKQNFIAPKPIENDENKTINF